jgi:hypothetical protein
LTEKGCYERKGVRDVMRERESERENMRRERRKRRRESEIRIYH